jgi:peptidyl-prolyl cis-trans isomerase D
MFDLFRSRDKAVRILLGALLLLVALSMLTYLVPNYNTGQSSNSSVVAEIGGKDTLTVEEVQRAVQNAVRGGQLPSSLLATYVPQMVDQMITERALVYQAESQGLQVSDAELRDAIQDAAGSALFPDGKFVGKQQYAALLAQQNMTIEQFESNLRREILVSRLRNVATEGIVVTPAEIAAEYQKRNEKLKIGYVKVPTDKYRKEAEPSAKESLDFFNANKGGYQVPEKRNLALLVADQAKMEAAVTVTDADLERTYNQNKEAYRVQDRVKVRHILLKTQGKPAGEEPQIKAKSESLLAQIRGGGNFAELAKKNSEDTGSAANGGELGDWVTRGQTVPEFEKVAFTLKPGETSGLVKTEYGYHILQVLQKEEGHVRTFAEVKAELAVQWKKQIASQLMQKIADQAQTLLQKDPASYERIASSLSLQVTKVDGYIGKADGYATTVIPELGPSAEFTQSLTGLKANQVSQPVAVGTTKLAMAVVTAVIPARPQTYEEAEAAVRDRMIQARTNVAVTKHSQELFDRAKANGGDLEKAAKEMGLEYKTSAEFTRTGSIDGLGSAAYATDAFNRPAGSLFGPVPTSEGTFVGKSLARVSPDQAQMETQRIQIRDDLRNNKARERMSLFEAGVKSDLERRGKIKIYKEALQRVLAAYHS